MANKVTITDTKNQVTITPQSSNNIDTSTTNTPVTVTQGTTSVVQVNNPGPQGPTGATGPVGAFNAGDDVIARHVTASGNISASGDIFVTNINPNGTTLNIGSTSNPGILHIQGDTQTGAGAGSPHLKLEGDWHPVAELDITLSQYGAEYDSHLHEFKSDGTNVVSITGTGGVQVANPLSIEAGTNRIVNLGGGQIGNGFRLRTGENLQTFNHTSFVYDWLEWTGTGADQGYKFHTYTHKNLITLNGNTANVEIGNSDTGSVKFLNGNITASGNISASGTIIADSLNITNGTIFGDNNGTDLVKISGSVEVTGSNGIKVTTNANSSTATVQLLSDGDGGIVKGGKRLTLKSHGGYDVEILSTSNQTLFKNNSSTTYAEIGDSTVGGTFFDTNITASGNISASGDITASQMLLERSGSVNLTLNSTQNGQSSRIDLREDGGNFGAYLEYDSSDFHIGSINGGVDTNTLNISRTGPATFNHDVNIALNSKLTIDLDNDTTNASLAIIDENTSGDIFTIRGTGQQNDATLFLSGSSHFKGNITASGNISASEDIIGKDIFGQTLFTDFGLFLRNSSLSDLAIQNETNNTGFIRFLTKREDTQVERLRIKNNGNIGIGTNDPGEKLEVVGNISASGDIFADTASFFNIILDHRGTAEPTLTFESDGGPDFTFGFNGDNNLQLSGQTGASGQTFSLASEVENFKMNSGGTILATAGNNAGTGSKHDGGLFVENQNSETSNGKAAQFTALSTGGVLKNTAYGGTGKHGTFKFINGGNLNNGIDATEHVVAEFGPTSSAHFTFHVPITASGDVSATRFIASGSNTTSGFVFPNPDNLTDLVSNRITLTSAKNMQFRAGGNFQFASIAEILNGNALMLKNDGNNGKIHLENAGTGIESRIRFRTGSGANIVELMTISGSGKIGIGNNNPTKTLTVEGDISASGDIIGANISGSGLFISGAGGITVRGNKSTSGSIQFFDNDTTASIELAIKDTTFSGELGGLFARRGNEGSETGYLGWTNQMGGGQQYYLRSRDGGDFMVNTVTILEIKQTYVKVQNVDKFEVSAPIVASSHITASGNISGSRTGSFKHLELNYDTMPTSDPNIKGVVYRSSSHGMDNLLFISPGS